ncbi:hypothetical protein ACJJTC_018815 [Scirpophaga incertulas]
MIQPQVKENESTKILWEMPVHTDITVTHNRPDLIYIDKLNNKTYLIDITVPSDYNIGAKEIEKLSKYHLLKTEVSRLWNTQVTVIPIVIGSTGVVAKSLKRYTDKLDANIDITILQKQAAIHTSIIISKRFAKVQTLIGIAGFLKKFKVEPSPKTSYDLKFDPTAMILNTKDGIWVKTSKRQQ